RDVVRLVFVRAVRMAPRSAIPNTPPTSRDVFVVALALPDRWGGTDDITAAVIGVMVRPMPTPMIGSAYQKSPYVEAAVTPCSSSSDVPHRASPIVMGIRDPIRPARRPASGAVTMIAPVVG